MFMLNKLFESESEIYIKNIFRLFSQESNWMSNRQCIC